MNRPGTGLVGVLAMAVLALGGCGGQPLETGLSGVDGLEIPTPSADPDDFVGGIDNPWLPLQPGNRWVYDSRSGGTAEVSVSDDTREIQGVTATTVAVVETDSDGSVQERTEWYAQDTAGNVWLFGQDDSDGSWEAGVDGAEAGVAMLAKPRVGDGYRQGLAPGVAEDRATVLSLDESVNVDSGSYADVLQVEVTSPLAPTGSEHRYYAEGVGLVYQESVAGGFVQLELTSFTQS